MIINYSDSGRNSNIYAIWHTEQESGYIASNNRYAGYPKRIIHEYV